MRNFFNTFVDVNAIDYSYFYPGYKSVRENFEKCGLLKKESHQEYKTRLLIYLYYLTVRDAGIVTINHADVFRYDFDKTILDSEYGRPIKQLQISHELHVLNLANQVANYFCKGEMLNFTTGNIPKEIHVNVRIYFHFHKQYFSALKNYYDSKIFTTTHAYDLLLGFDAKYPGYRDNLPERFAYVISEATKYIAYIDQLIGDIKEYGICQGQFAFTAALLSRNCAEATRFLENFKFFLYLIPRSYSKYIFAYQADVDLKLHIYKICSQYKQDIPDLIATVKLWYLSFNYLYKLESKDIKDMLTNASPHECFQNQFISMSKKESRPLWISLLIYLVVVSVLWGVASFGEFLFLCAAIASASFIITCPFILHDLYQKYKFISEVKNIAIECNNLKAELKKNDLKAINQVSVGNSKIILNEDLKFDKFQSISKTNLKNT